MIKACENLFDIVKLQFDLSPGNILGTEFYTARTVKGNANDRNWLANCKISDVFNISTTVSFCIIEHHLEIYLAAIGYDSPDVVPDGFDFFQLNSGLFTAIVSDLEVPPRSDRSIYYLEENILSQHVNIQGYAGHELNDLIDIFPNIHVFKITNQFTGDCRNILQLASIYISANKKFILLPLSERSLHNLQNLTLCNSKIISYENIIQALVSSHFKFCFLDLYRCIEMLYQIIYVDETYTILGLTSPKIDFLYAIDTYLKWKPTERTSLAKLFSLTPNSHGQGLINAVQKISNRVSDHSGWLYDLRCNIVHLKSQQQTIQITNNQWDELIIGIAKFLEYWYQRYQVF